MSVLSLIFTSFFLLNHNVEVPTDSETKIKWYTWEEAHALSKDNPKKVFIDLYTDWCGWCKKMDASTFQEPDVIKYLNENFYPVKFNAEQKETIVFNGTEFTFIDQGRRGVHQLAYALLDGRLGYPAFVMLDESFARIMISPGFKQSPQLMKELEFAKEEKYKEMSWDDYSRAD
jgi:thioredoxin-related protein